MQAGVGTPVAAEPKDLVGAGHSISRKRIKSKGATSGWTAMSRGLRSMCGQLGSLRSRRRVPTTGIYDVLALQEIFRSPFMPSICNQERLMKLLRLKGGYSHFVRSPMPNLLKGHITDSGLLIASKHPIVESDSFTFSAGVALDAGAAKGVIFARVQLAEGTCVDVFNVHLQATHTRSAGKGSSYTDVRAMQVAELVRFIRRKTHGKAHPWMLTGDFNVDAIASDISESSGLALYTAADGVGESDEYRDLVRALAPAGAQAGAAAYGIADLLKLRFGRHVSTRPPRLQFPQDMRYALKHKYPMRLDIVWWCQGAASSLLPIVEETRVVEFRVDHRGQDKAAQRKWSGSRRKYSVPAAGLGQPHRGGDTHKNGRSRDGSSSSPSAFLSGAGNSRRKRPYEFLSDHFAIEVLIRRQQTDVAWDAAEDDLEQPGSDSASSEQRQVREQSPAIKPSLQQSPVLRHRFIQQQLQRVPSDLTRINATPWLADAPPQTSWRGLLQSGMQGSDEMDEASLWKLNAASSSAAPQTRTASPSAAVAPSNEQQGGPFEELRASRSGTL